MKKLILILFGLICLISCKENKKIEIIESDKLNESELVVQEILDLPDLQDFYHPEMKERLPLKILESELIDKKFNLYKFGQRVRILSLAELEREGIKDYLEFQKLEFQVDRLNFELSYRIEGAVSVGKMIKIKGKWNILDYWVGEI